MQSGKTRSQPALTRRKLLRSMGVAMAAPALLRPVSAADTLNAGVIQPLSGANAQFGINSRNGIKLAADRINKAGGIAALGGAGWTRRARSDGGSTSLGR